MSAKCLTKNDASSASNLCAKSSALFCLHHVPSSNAFCQLSHGELHRQGLWPVDRFGSANAHHLGDLTAAAACVTAMRNPAAETGFTSKG
jgi:hypothetical protein